MKKYIFPTILLALSLVTDAAAQTVLNAKAPEFELSDQHGQLRSLRSLAGRVIVLLASDKDGAEQNRHWGNYLVQKYGDRIAIVRIADVRTVPFFMKEKIRNDFKKDVNPILLDWDGSVFRAYGMKNKAANVALIDRNGVLRVLHSGSAEPEAIGRVCREIDKLE